MSPRILRTPFALVFAALVLAACAWPHAALARTATATIARVTTGLATLDRVEVRLDWPAEAEAGTLQLHVGALSAPSLGYAFRDLRWRCPLRRDGAGGWRCAGEVVSGRARPMRLDVALGAAFTDAVLAQGEARVEVHRQAAAPDATRVDLVRVPLLWTQALLDRAWSAGRLKQGRADARLTVDAPANAPLRVSGPLAIAGAGLETADGAIAAENLGGRFALDMRFDGPRTSVGLDGALQGGEFLYGSAYVALPATPVGLTIAAAGDARGWRLPTIAWRDGKALSAQGQAAFDPGGDLQALDVALRSDDLAPLPARYLSGWLGSAGLGDLALDGALDARLRLDGEGLRDAEARLSQVTVRDGKDRFRFDGLDGDVRYVGGATPATSDLAWRGGQLYGLAFGATTLALRSADGRIGLRSPATLSAVGGTLRFDRFELRPPAGERRLEAGFGLTLDGIDIGRLAQGFGWPAFRGTLGGRIPDARYANDRLSFEGGLDMAIFDGQVHVSSLAMERPFGVAPTLSADVALQGLDLLAVTEVFDFGSISGRLDGSIRDLRLVDWTATAFDAEFHTVPRKGERQRISQRAVQNISSVGDASFVSTLQGKLIGLFDDFGYRRIGIACRLQNTVCTMSGLEGVAGGAAGDAPETSGSAGGFTIVEGAGLPRLRVVGFNRHVDWPTLVERLQAVGSGDVAPVIH